MIERTFAKITGIQLDQQVSIDGSNQNCHFISFGLEFVGKTWPGADTGVPSSRLFFPQEVNPGQLMVSRALDANNLPPAIIAINKTAVQVGGVPAYSVAIGRWSNSPNPAIAVGDEVIFVGNTNPLPTGLQLIPGTTAEIASALVDYRDFTEGLACDIWSNTRFPDENIISGILEGDNVFTGDNTFGGERVSVNNTYTVQLTNRYVDVDASSSNIPITAYDPVGNAGKKLTIEKTDSTTNNVTVDIDNDASPDITLTLASPITHLKSNGTIWEVIAEGDAITKFTGQSEFSNDVSFNGRSEFSNDVSFKEGVSFEKPFKSPGVLLTSSVNKTILNSELGVSTTVKLLDTASSNTIFTLPIADLENSGKNLQIFNDSDHYLKILCSGAQLFNDIDSFTTISPGGRLSFSSDGLGWKLLQNRVLIENKSADGTTSFLNLTSEALKEKKYKYLEFQLTNADVSTSADDLSLRVSLDGGTTWEISGYAYSGLLMGSAILLAMSTSDNAFQFVQGGTQFLGGENLGLNVRGNILNHNSNTDRTVFYTDGFGSNVYSHKTTGRYGADTIVNGIQFITGGGNLSNDCKIYLWGIL